ncbi:metal-dependent transcriptional regulator [Coprococcus comes]|uniref:Metal-dependent transcriptional regulator n=1 Tax=Coprococcus comes TaxID=410072 RepID=A0A3R6DZ65_9FIRM|nr:metal-dependent transcriptional regulator [Coprococcus comes]RHG60246.1 metal-dependent transcriptional regulator [Coprococcus comes]
MKLGESKEDYLEAMYILNRQKGYVIKDEHGYVELTAEGKKIAKKVYARHLLLKEFLELIGVSPETANHDACRMEHTISEESFQKIQELVKKIKKENASNEQMQLTN